MKSDIAKLHAEAIAQGHKDETCSKCGTLFLAHIHFIRCDAAPCPMRSTHEPRSLLEQWASAVPSHDLATQSTDPAP